MSTTKLLLTLTTEQKVKIIARAGALGLSVSDYLRHLINADIGISADGIQWGGARVSDEKGG
jgi:hypothetical protein